MIDPPTNRSAVAKTGKSPFSVTQSETRKSPTLSRFMLTACTRIGPPLAKFFLLVVAVVIVAVIVQLVRLSQLPTDADKSLFSSHKKIVMSLTPPPVEGNRSRSLQTTRYCLPFFVAGECKALLSGDDFLLTFVDDGDIVAGPSLTPKKRYDLSINDELKMQVRCTNSIYFRTLTARVTDADTGNDLFDPVSVASSAIFVVVDIEIICRR